MKNWKVLGEIEQQNVSICYDEPLSKHTSFRIGGAVKALICPKDELALKQTLALLYAEQIEVLLIGNGSNMLVSDKALDCVAIKLKDGLDAVRQTGETELYAEAGAMLSRAATVARDLSLGGLSFAHGIPGTIGGAVMMNAGAYGGEMAQVVSAVRYLDANLQICELPHAALDFSYRHSRFCGTQDVILGASLRLAPRSVVEIEEEMRNCARARKEKQPLEFPSAGSTFKRPQGGYAAALIDECGLKGYRIGGAEVSEKHAGFVINRGGATCDDVQKLIAHIQEVVLRETGVSLECEVKHI